MKDFGITVEQRMVNVTGRILPPPLLQYGGKVNVSLSHTASLLHSTVSVSVSMCTSRQVSCTCMHIHVQYM